MVNIICNYSYCCLSGVDTKKAHRTLCKNCGDFQLILNLGWSFLFFYNHLIGAALIEIVALLAAILINGLVFYKINKTAGLLFIPYFIWVSFATLLNYNIFILNQV
ncbi:TspO/MBR family protein [Pedobacter westerhofensis]|uniref:TspO/MBR family protein n=1 Tax=Pedobacter westerhofensis TaxID=425512 RepID=UPI0021D1919E|nr:TspO/MBR family protein [Pedobacter westerhofensis]